MTCEKILGIDLGTSYSCMAIMEAGKPIVIPNSEGGRKTPSVVAFTKDWERLVGSLAKRQAVTNPMRTIQSIKRKMGFPEKVKIDDKEYTPQEISAMILQKLKIDAEAYLGEKITKAVISVPAYFNEAQRTATKDAGKIAGLEVLRIISEPVATAFVYGIGREKDETVLIYDFGGGALSVAIITIGDGVFEVKSVAGNIHLGGDDFDKLITDFLVDEFRKKEGIDLRNDPYAMQRLRETSENAKIDLSNCFNTNITLPYITTDATGPKVLNVDVTRSKLEQLIGPLVESIVGPVKQALSDVKLEPKDIDQVFFVGGSTHIPLVQETVKKFLGKKSYITRNADECVALGAAIQGAVLTGVTKDIVLLDVTPFTLSIGTSGGVVTRLIQRNSTIPTRMSQIFSTTTDGQTSVEINAVQGECALTKDNFTLQKFQLTGIPPARWGVPQIEVTFDIDIPGNIHVSTKDLGTGIQQAISIKGYDRISDEDLKKMIDTAKQFESEEKNKREEIELRHQAATAILTAEKMLKETSEKLDADDKQKIESTVADFKKALEDNNLDRIKKSMEFLTEAVYVVTTKIYQKVLTEQKAQQAAGIGEPPNPVAK